MYAYYIYFFSVSNIDFMLKSYFQKQYLKCSLLKQLGTKEVCAAVSNQYALINVYR